jgi:hypothetical protein
VARLRFEVEVPVLQQRLLKPPPLQWVAIIGAYFSSTLPADVIEMLRDTAKASGATRDLDDHLWGAPNGTGDVRDLRLG